MLSAGSETFDLFLGAGIAGLRRPNCTPTWQTHDDVAIGLRNMLDLVEGRRLMRWLRPTLRVWLSGALARPFVLPLPTGLSDVAEACELAAAAAVDATGLREPCTAWLERSLWEDACMAVAVEIGLRDDLLEVSVSRRVHLATIRPWWARALDRALACAPDFKMFAASDPESVVLLTWVDERWETAECYAPRPDDLQIESLITRRLFSTGIEAAEACRVVLDPGHVRSTSSWPAARSTEAFATP